MIKTILFAADMGAYTSFLLHHVNTLAEQNNARIVVLHVIEPPSQVTEAMVKAYLPQEQHNVFNVSGMTNLIGQIKSRLVDLLEDEFMDGQDGLSRVDHVNVVAGHPTETILDQARAHQADMIVMGSHTHNAINPNLLGSVTAKVLQLSRVPVYMVPLFRIPLAKTG
jgi:nucleotide-binding universal stress UspA family protein